MSYITESLIEKTLQRLQSEAGLTPDAIIYAPEIHSFSAKIGGKSVHFRIPEDVLHSAPLDYVVDRYLRRLVPVAKHAEDAE